MKTEHLTFDETISAVRGLSVKEAATLGDIDFSISVLKLAIRRLEEEKRKRKAESKN